MIWFFGQLVVSSCDEGKLDATFNVWYWGMLDNFSWCFIVLLVDEKGIRIESTEDLPSIGSLHIKGTEGYIKHLMEHIHDEVDDLKRNAKTLANAGVNVSKSVTIFNQ